MPITYKQTPVAEAVFECFVHPGDWSPEVNERLVRRFSDRYTQSPEAIRGLIGVQIKVTPIGAETIQHVADRIRVRNSDNTRLIQFGRDMVAFNALPPYDAYPVYMPAFREIFDAFIEEARPARLQFLGQRYINRISLPEDADPANYFTHYPKLDSGRKHRQFTQQFEASTLSSGALMIALGFEGVHDGRPRYVVDLYARSADDPPLALTWDAVAEWNNNAHQALFAAFDTNLTTTGQAYLGRERT
jgi:uncharacterized protein (TIGR04255 family)